MSGLLQNEMSTKLLQEDIPYCLSSLDKIPAIIALGKLGSKTEGRTSALDLITGNG